jgi:hypothetical protein
MNGMQQDTLNRLQKLYRRPLVTFAVQNTTQSLFYCVNEDVEPGRGYDSPRCIGPELATSWSLDRLILSQL